jgi:Trk K+ transport system NAD-binding subunit
VALQSIADIGKTLALRLGGERYASFIRLYLDYKEVVGKLLAQKSHPYRYKDDVLFVAVENNSWLQELVLKKQELIARYQAVSRIKPKDILFFIRTPKDKS